MWRGVFLQMNDFIEAKGAVVASVATADVDKRCIEVVDPRRAVRALEMMAAGDSYREIRAETGLSFQALVNLRARHEVALEVRRRQLAQDGFELQEGIRQVMREKIRMIAEDPKQMEKTTLKDLSISYAIAQDKALQALGENKVVVEHRGGKPSLEDARRAIEEARAKLRSGAIEVLTKPAQSSSLQ